MVARYLVCILCVPLITIFNRCCGSKIKGDEKHFQKQLSKKSILCYGALLFEERASRRNWQCFYLNLVVCFPILYQVTDGCLETLNITEVDWIFYWSWIKYCEKTWVKMVEWIDSWENLSCITKTSSLACFDGCLILCAPLSLQYLIVVLEVK